jgi:hypothetical protein
VNTMDRWYAIGEAVSASLPATTGGWEAGG